MSSLVRCPRSFVSSLVQCVWVPCVPLSHLKVIWTGRWRRSSIESCWSSSTASFCRLTPRVTSSSSSSTSAASTKWVDSMSRSMSHSLSRSTQCHAQCHSRLNVTVNSMPHSTQCHTKTHSMSHKNSFNKIAYSICNRLSWLTMNELDVIVNVRPCLCVYWHSLFGCARHWEGMIWRTYDSWWKDNNDDDRHSLKCRTHVCDCVYRRWLRVSWTTCGRCCRILTHKLCIAKPPPPTYLASSHGPRTSTSGRKAN